MMGVTLMVSALVLAGALLALSLILGLVVVEEGMLHARLQRCPQCRHRYLAGHDGADGHGCGRH